MEDQRLFSPKELAAELKQRTAEIERLKAENLKLEQLRSDAESYLGAFNVRLQVLTENIAQIGKRAADPQVVQACLGLVQGAMDSLKMIVDVSPWSKETVKMIRDATGRVAQTAKNIAESAEENVVDFGERMDTFREDLHEVLSRMKTKKKGAPEKEEPKKH